MTAICLDAGVMPLDQLAQKIIRKAANTNMFLNQLQDKRPHQCLNDVLSSFVNVVYPFYDDCLIHTVLNDRLIADNLANLRKKLSECEFELEVYWAQKIIEEKAHYTDYPYMSGYAALCGAERDYLEKILQPTDHSFCFIGAGPMPITAFELKRYYPDVSMHGIEMDKGAIDLAQQVSLCSGVQVDYTQACAECADFASYDVVFVASMTINKKQVMERIAKTAKNGTIIAVRSVERLRSMLYEPVAVDMIPDCFASLGKTPYTIHHANTTLFYRLQK